MLQQKRKIMVTNRQTGEDEEFSYLHMEDRVSSAGDMYYHRYRLKDKDGHIFECNDYYAIYVIDDQKSLMLKGRKLIPLYGSIENMTVIGGYDLGKLDCIADELYHGIVNGTRTGSPKLPLPSPQELMDEFLDKLEEEIGTSLEFDSIRYELECKYDYLPREQQESVQHSAEKE